MQKSRTLVLCFDGTKSEYDEDNTNIVKLFAMLKKDDFNEQMCYYQAGIGTWFNPGVVSPLFKWGAKVLDNAFAWYLDAHVMDGYKFLMQNYRVRDQICLFGFSRGAYTARALAGALYKVGLLPKDNESQVPFAYKLYKRKDPKGIELCAGFKQTYCQDVKVEFLGVWDTVASAGIVMGRTLPYTNSNRGVKMFRHALSLDERRVRFQPHRFHGSKVSKGAPPNDGKPSTDTTSLVSKKEVFRGPVARSTGKAFLPDLVEGEERDDVLEVWFAGCHSDVGGGAVPNKEPHSLANVSLRWMVREILKSGCEIQWVKGALEKNHIHKRTVDSDAGLQHSKESQDNDDIDSLERTYDELKHITWWLLEIMPYYAWQDAKGVWHRNFGIHFGKGRKIDDEKPNFHSSVKHRMKSKGYEPKAKWTKGSEVYID